MWSQHIAHVCTCDGELAMRHIQSAPTAHTALAGSRPTGHAHQPCITNLFMFLQLEGFVGAAGVQQIPLR